MDYTEFTRDGPAIRPFMQRRIDALHAEVERLVAVEKAYQDRKNPLPNGLLRTVRDCRIEVAAWSPARKAAVVRTEGHA